MRNQSLQILTEVLKAQANVLAAWEGGSAATGRLDQYSDIDLNMLLSDDNDETVWQIIDQTIPRIFELDRKWIVDSPIKGFSQRFYIPKEPPNFFFLDIGIFKKSAPDLFLDQERHGRAKFLFDKTGTLKVLDLDKKDFEQKIFKRLEQLENQFVVYEMITLKEIRRDRPIDAFGFYQACLRFLNEALGLRFRKYKYDFGFRYQHFDMPKEIQEQMQELIFVGKFEELEPKLEKLKKLFLESLRLV